MNAPSVSRALAAGKFMDYLMGYVAGIDYYEYGEWLLTERGGWSAMRPCSKEDDSHVWPTREQALAAARRFKHSHPTFTRPYVYSTPTPEHAKGMPLFDRAIHGEKEYITP